MRISEVLQKLYALNAASSTNVIGLKDDGDKVQVLFGSSSVIAVSALAQALSGIKAVSGDLPLAQVVYSEKEDPKAEFSPVLGISVEHGEGLPVVRLSV